MKQIALRPDVGALNMENGTRKVKGKYQSHVVAIREETRIFKGIADLTATKSNFLAAV
jgi:hypothetical protein